jgi:hypothetical protein
MQNIQVMPDERYSYLCYAFVIFYSCTAMVQKRSVLLWAALWSVAITSTAHALTPVEARELRARALSPYPAHELAAYSAHPIAVKELVFPASVKAIAAKEVQPPRIPAVIAHELKPTKPLPASPYNVAGNTVAIPKATATPVVAHATAPPPAPQLKPYVPRSQNPEDYDPAAY